MDEQTKFSIDLIREIEELKLLYGRSINEQNSINTDQIRINLTFGAIFTILGKILIDKNIVTEEEFDQYLNDETIKKQAAELEKGQLV